VSNQSDGEYIRRFCGLVFKGCSPLMFLSSHEPPVTRGGNSEAAPMPEGAADETCIEITRTK